MKERRSFTKMNGLGNDFAVVDARAHSFEPREVEVRLWADRKSGIGFDQLISLERSFEGDVYMRVWNADGSNVPTCGNALRCVAFLMDRERKGKTHTIETQVAMHKASVITANQTVGHVSVDMGKPKLGWKDIPLREEMDTLKLECQIGPIDAPLYHTPVAVNMGNPHCVFFVDDVMSVDVEKSGSMIENHPLFPKATNVEFAQILDRGNIRMRVWERGSGITKACGTGACATAVAAIRRGLVDRTVNIVMDGGPLHIHWAENDRVYMTGPIEVEFEGQLP